MTETNKEKGERYEMQIRDYIINVLNKPAYLWSHVPESLLVSCGIIGSHNEHRLKRKDNRVVANMGHGYKQIKNLLKIKSLECIKYWKRMIMLKKI